MRSAIIQVFSLLILSTSALAAPSLSGVSGSVIHGQSITMSGSSFGTKSPAAPLLWDSVDGMYAGITENGAVPTGGTNPWEFSGGSGMDNPVFTLQTPRGKWTAKYSNKQRLCVGCSTVLGEKDWAAARSNMLYVSWWMYPHQNPGNPGASNKLLRLTSNGGYDGDFASLIVDPGSGNVFLHSNPTGYVDIEYPPTFGTTGVWNRQEILANNTTNPHPAATYTVNNALQVTLNPSSSISAIGGIFTIGADWTNAQNNPVPRLDWGEIYVDSTPARVEICNASTKASSNHCEIQIPSAWSTTSITATVNQGSFADGSTAYLYVVDSAGAANSTGTAITFGSGGGDTTAPTTTATPSAGSYPSAQTVTLSCSDDTACTSTQYCTGSACTPSTSYTGALSIATTTTLRYRSSDAAGNMETIKESVYTINSGGAQSSAAINCSTTASFQ